MRKLLFFLLTFMLLQPAFSASSPAHPLNEMQPQVVQPTNKETIVQGLPKNKKAKKPNLIQRAKMKLLFACQAKGLLVDGEMTEKQKRQAKWSMILGLSSIVLLAIPFVGLLGIAAAIVGLILGIKSVQGNSNTKGIIGIIASGLTLLLLILAIVLLAVLLSNWN